MNDFSHQFQPGDVTRWPRVSLGEVCEINPRAPKGLPGEASAAFIPMAAVSEDGSILREATCLINEVRKGYTYFNRHDVLLAKITPCFENGKATRTHNLAHEIGFASTEFHVLRASDRILPDYVFHLIWNSSLRTYGAENMTGSAGQKRLPKDFLQRLEIPLPPLDEQRRIAAILDKADALRRKRKRALELLDGLTQSIFLEMFGDPVRNPHGFPKKPIGDVLKVRSGNGLTAKQMDTAGSIPVYGGNGISGYHTKAMFSDPQVVIGRVGVYCGAVHLTSGPSWITDNALYISHYKQATEQTYLLHALRLANLNQYAGRAAQPLISGSRIYPVEIVLPSMELQQRFSRAALSARKEVEQQEEALAKLEAMFSSLQSRAFSGQL